jgi:hypothetical protein
MVFLIVPGAGQGFLPTAEAGGNRGLILREWSEQPRGLIQSIGVIHL